MKCKIFYGRVDQVAANFNTWAKGKMLTKDVIIHSLAFPAVVEGDVDLFAILVFHPEDPFWDKTVGVETRDIKT